MAALAEAMLQPSDLTRVAVVEALPGRPITGPRLVRPDGKISFTDYGSVHIPRLTTVEIKEKVISHLRRYLSNNLLGIR